MVKYGSTPAVLRNRELVPRFWRGGQRNVCKFSRIQHTSAFKVMLGYVCWQPTVILRVAVTVLKVIVRRTVLIVLALFFVLTDLETHIWTAFKRQVVEVTL